MAKKRERLEVIYDILKSIKDNDNHIGPTKLLSKSNLSPQMYKEYMEELLSKSFILQKEEEKNKIYSLGEKGIEFLQKYQVIVDIVDNLGL